MDENFGKLSYGSATPTIDSGFVGVYARVSTEDQAEKGYSLPEQLRECTIKAQKITPDPVREYADDGFTGELLNRPALDRLFDDIKKGIVHTVVCLSQDRLSRNALVYLQIVDYLYKHKVNLQYVNMTVDQSNEGQLADGVLALAAQYNKRKILSDTARGRRSKAREGKVLRDFEIYGYNYNKKTAQLEIKEDEAKIVYEIWERFCIYDHSLNSIAKDLTERNVPTKRGGAVWHRQVVRQLLLQEAYTGTFYANKWNCEGMGINKFRSNEEEKVKVSLRDKSEWIPITCPPIVPVEWRNIVNIKFASNRKNYAGQRGVGGYVYSAPF